MRKGNIFDGYNPYLTGKLIFFFAIFLVGVLKFFSADLFAYTTQAEVPSQSIQIAVPKSQLYKNINSANHFYTNIIQATVAPTPTPTLKPVKITIPSGDTVQLARSIAQQYNINEDAFLCIIQKESGFNSRRPDGSLKCSDHGASCGLGQIQYPTWVSIRRKAGWSTEDLRADDTENLKTVAFGLTNGWKLHWTAYHVCKAQGYDL